MASAEIVAWVIAGFSVLMVVSILASVGESHNKSRVLEQLCAEVGGVSIGGDKVEVRHRSWLITISMETETDTTGHDDGVGASTTTTTREYTRVRAPYFATDNFQFRIYPKGCFSRLGILLGMQDVNLGDPSFNSPFVVKGSDEAKLHELLGNLAIRELMQREPKMTLTRKADNSWFFRKLPEGMDELYLEIEEKILDVGRLKSLTLLTGEVLEELVSIGSATETRLGAEV